MFKLVINQLDKIFITSDTATIVKEMEVVHPAAKLIVEMEPTLLSRLLESYWRRLRS